MEICVSNDQQENIEEKIDLSHITREQGFAPIEKSIFTNKRQGSIIFFITHGNFAIEFHNRIHIQLTIKPAKGEKNITLYSERLRFLPVLIPLQDIDRKKQVNIEEIYQKQAQEPLQDKKLFTVYADVTDGTTHEICYVH